MPNVSLNLFDGLKARFGHKVLGKEMQGGREVTVLSADGWVEVVSHLKQEGMDHMMDLGGADYSGYPGHEGDPLCVSLQLFSTLKKQRAWLKVYLPLEGAKLDTLSNVYGCANWYERECWDMYGVNFDGHPYQRRLLLYDEFEGHPLRKDYPILKMQPLIPMRNAIDYEAIAQAKRLEAAAQGAAASPSPSAGTASKGGE
jgi:NADH-quinone oxidoreductase subunit C